MGIKGSDVMINADVMVGMHWSSKVVKDGKGLYVDLSLCD